MKDLESKAFDFAGDTTKQLITLSIGILALTISFSKDIIGTMDPATKSILGFAWIFYLLSIIFGIWTLMALTGELEPLKRKKNGLDKNSAITDASDVAKEIPQEIGHPSIRNTNVTRPSLLQIVTFIIGTILIVVFGVISIF